MIFATLFLIFIGIQILWGGSRGTSVLAISAIPAMLIGAAHLFMLDTTRTLVLSETVIGAYTPWLTSILFLCFVIFAFLRKDRDPRLALFHLTWLVCVFCSVPIVRQDTLLYQEIPHYYSILVIVPMFLLIEHAIGGSRALVRVPKPLAFPILAMMIVVVLLLDLELKNLFSFRHFRNQQALVTGMLQGGEYVAFDDPYFTNERQKVDNPIAIYSYWSERTKFSQPFGYSKDLRNWIPETVLNE